MGKHFDDSDSTYFKSHFFPSVKSIKFCLFAETLLDPKSELNERYTFRIRVAFSFAYGGTIVVNHSVYVGWCDA